MRNWLIVLAVLVVPIVVLAAGGAERYEWLTAVPVELVTDATGADSTTATTIIAGRAKESLDNPTAVVSCDFSGSSGDTCEISCLLYVSTDGGSTLNFIGLSTSTVTAGDYVDAAGDNIGTLVMFDLAGSTHYEIRHAAPSAGNVDITTWVIGSASQ